MVTIKRVKQIVKDFAERALWSGGQQFAVVLLGASAVTSVVGFPWVAAAATGAGAAIVSVLLTAGQYLTGLTGLNRWQDIAVRAVKSFAASLLGSFVGSDMVFNVLNVGWLDAVQLAAVVTIGAVAKGYITSSPNATASTMIVAPPTTDPTEPEA